MNLENDLTINQEMLDNELIKLPSLYFKYREELDFLEIKSRKKKMQLDYEMAILDKEARLNSLEVLGIAKPTEAHIKNYVERNEKLYEIREQILTIEKDKRLVQSAVTALEMKKDALKSLVMLANSEYFTTKRSDQTVNGQSQVFVEENKRNIRREMRERLNNKKEQ